MYIPVFIAITVLTIYQSISFVNGKCPECRKSLRERGKSDKIDDWKLRRT